MISTNRLKERGGVGGKVTASKPSKTQNPSSPAKSRSSSVRKSTPVLNPNPNPRSVSAGRRRDPTPNRVEKPSVIASGVRKSTSSVPRSRGTVNPLDSLRIVPATRVSGIDRVSTQTRASGTDRVTTQTRVSGTDRLGRTVSKDNGVEIGLRRSANGGIRVLGSDGSKGNGSIRGLEKCNIKSVKKSDNKESLDCKMRSVSNENCSNSSLIDTDTNIKPDPKNTTRVSKDNGVEIGLRRSANGGIRVLGCDGSKGNGSIRVLEKCNFKSAKKSDSKKESLVLDGKTLSVSNDNCLNSTLINTDTKFELDQNNTASLPIYTVKWDYTNSSNSNELKEIKEKQVPEDAKVLDRVKIFEKARDNSTQITNNYPSKLHEKLAILEGRVQKIASEIKKTKEILDENNPDESKLILSDIQNKISSVEKAVVHVGTQKTLNPKYSSKGLNCEELESRFFPHQKLLKSNNKISKNTSLTNNIDEKNIEVEFLASLTCTKPNPKPFSCTDTASSSKNAEELELHTNERIEDLDSSQDSKIQELDSQETKSGIVVQEESDEVAGNVLGKIGNKCATGGWFVSEGESVLLAHADGTCLYYDIVNCEEKTEYKPPNPVPQNTFTDCWLVRAPGTDGCSGRYVITASSGFLQNTPYSGFCTWDFYKKTVTSFHLEIPNSSQTLNPNQVWYRPCGPLLISATSGQKSLSIFDIRDGDLVMRWENRDKVCEMEASSPVQWRGRGKVVISGNESVSLYDVNSVSAEALVAVGSGGKRVLAMHVLNCDAEVGGGVRQRVSSSEAEGIDGIFCTQDSINVLDFRVPTGTGTKISRNPNSGTVPVSVFSKGDSVYLGCTEDKLLLKGGNKSRIQHFSVRKGKQVLDFEIPDLSSGFKSGIVNQVWGNESFTMGVCGKGLFVFYGTGTVRERIGTEGELKNPSFDYSGSRVLLVSRDRPAMWKYV